MPKWSKIPLQENTACEILNMEERKNYTNVNLVKGVSINKNVVREHTKTERSE